MDNRIVPAAVGGGKSRRLVPPLLTKMKLHPTRSETEEQRQQSEEDEEENDEEASATTSNLCLSLLACLRSRPNLDALAKKTLIDVKIEIETMLTEADSSRIRWKEQQHGASTHSLSRATIGSGLPARIISSISSRALVGGSSSDQSLAAFPSSTPRNLHHHADHEDRSSKSPPKRHNKQTLVAPISLLSLRSGAEEESKSKNRRKKKRALAAVYPYIQLSDFQSQQSVLQRLNGGGLISTMWRYKRFVFCLKWPAGGISCMGIILVFINLSEWSAPVARVMSEGAFLALSASSYSLGLAYYLFCCFFIMNYQIASLVIRQLEAFFFLWEVTLACLSLWGLLCFQPYGFILSLNHFVFFLCFICYDSLPISFRALRRRENILLLLIWVMQMALVYTKVSNHMCYYRVSLTRGMYLDDEDFGQNSTSSGATGCLSAPMVPSSSSAPNDATARWLATSSKKNALSFSLFDFFLNRAFTLLVYMAKIIYYSFQRPEDCVIIRSNVRLIEMAMPEVGTPTSTTKKGVGGAATLSSNTTTTTT